MAFELFLGVETIPTNKKVNHMKRKWVADGIILLFVELNKG